MLTQKRKPCRNRLRKSRIVGNNDSVRTIRVFLLDENHPVNGQLLFNANIPLNATPEEVNRIIIDHPLNVHGNQITEGVYRIIAHVDDAYYIIENHPETELEMRLRNLQNQL